MNKAKTGIKSTLYANCMQMPKNTKGFHSLKPFTVLSGS